MRQRILLLRRRARSVLRNRRREGLHHAFGALDTVGREPVSFEAVLSIDHDVTVARLPLQNVIGPIDLESRSSQSFHDFAARNPRNASKLSLTEQYDEDRLR
jgi:hypothetical protein